VELAGPGIEGERVIIEHDQDERVALIIVAQQPAGRRGDDPFLDARIRKLLRHIAEPVENPVLPIQVQRVVGLAAAAGRDHAPWPASCAGSSETEDRGRS
jgi:hypothetical protein